MDREKIERRQAFWDDVEALTKVLFVVVLVVIGAALVQEIYQAGRRAGAAECREPL